MISSETVHDATIGNEVVDKVNEFTFLGSSSKQTSSKEPTRRILKERESVAYRKKAGLVKFAKMSTFLFWQLKDLHKIGRSGTSVSDENVQRSMVDYATNSVSQSSDLDMYVNSSRKKWGWNKLWIINAGNNLENRTFVVNSDKIYCFV